MDIRKPMTAIEKRIFKETIIREYKLRQKPKMKKTGFPEFMDHMRRYAPVNIFLGIIACILLIITTGWRNFYILILSGIIWITLITTALSAIAKTYDN